MQKSSLIERFTEPHKKSPLKKGSNINRDIFLTDPAVTGAGACAKPFP